MEGRVADTEWKPLPAGLWTLPAVFMEAGNLLLEAFMEAGVPTWKVREKTSDPLKWNMIAEGTADSFEAAKAAALYEAGGSRKGPRDIWAEGKTKVLGATRMHWADRGPRSRFPIHPRMREWPESKPTTAARPSPREPLFLPLSRHSSRFLIRRPQVNGARAGQR